MYSWVRLIAISLVARCSIKRVLFMFQDNLLSKFSFYLKFANFGAYLYKSDLLLGKSYRVTNKAVLINVLLIAITRLRGPGSMMMGRRREL